MDPAATFYQSLSGISFTLLGIWFGVMQFGHGGWRSDPARHRSTLHIALHFFLPGVASLVALLGAGTAGGAIWRVAFVVAGLLGFIESIRFLRAPDGPKALAGRTLRALDPFLYLLVIAGAFVPPDTLVVSPLQFEGFVNGALFVVGLCYVWLAFSERQPEDDEVDPRRDDEAREPTGRG